MNDTDLTGALRDAVTAHRDAVEVSRAPLAALRATRGRRWRLALGAALAAAAVGAGGAAVTAGAPGGGTTTTQEQDAGTMPSVLGMDTDAAIVLLQDLGYRVSASGRVGPDGEPNGPVTSQNPRPGARAAAGALVDLRFGVPAQTPLPPDGDYRPRYQDVALTLPTTCDHTFVDLDVPEVNDSLGGSEFMLACHGADGVGLQTGGTGTVAIGDPRAGPADCARALADAPPQEEEFALTGGVVLCKDSSVGSDPPLLVRLAVRDVAAGEVTVEVTAWELR